MSGWLRRLDVRIQLISELFEVLLPADHGRHEFSIGHVRLVMVEHGDEVLDVGNVGSSEETEAETSLGRP